MTRHGPFREYALVVLLLVVGVSLRLTGVDWDQGQHLHPDERFLTMVATSISAPDSIGHYFDTGTSPSNPANVGYPFFVYGTLPLFLTKLVASVLGIDSYAHVHIVGRMLSALFDGGTILLTWLFGRLLGGARVGLAAAALMAVSVPSIQHAHFFTVDSLAAFFALAALYGLLRVARGGRVSDHLLFGVSFGLALTCRIYLVLLAPFYALVAARSIWHGRRRARETLYRVALTAGVTALLFRIAQPYAFAGPGFFDVAPAPDFLANLSQVRDMVAGKVHFPPAMQWIGRVPVLFAGRNLLLWNMGPFWGLAALGGMVWLLGRGRSVDATERESRALGRIVWLWTAALFLFLSSQFAATVRYFLPLLPSFALFAVWPLARESSGRRSRLALAVVLGTTSLWALAFTSIYREEHTRVQASRWIYERVPPGSTLVVEHWDDALPLPLDDARATSYRQITLRIYDEDTEDKRAELVDALDASDYVILSSNRAYGSIPRSPWRYPLARRYYELLLAEELGFRLERVFTSYPRLGPIEISDDDAEEAFTVYDHPKVLLFEKESGFSRERVVTLLGAVPLDGILPVAPREATKLYRAAWPTSLSTPESDRRRQGFAGSPASSFGATLRWLGGIELSALSVFCILCPFLGIARDRGFALAKIIGWLAPGYLVLLSCSAGLTPSSLETARLAAFVLWTAGAIAAWRHRERLKRFVREQRDEWMTAQAVFLAGFTVFALFSVLNPAIFWGEKPMDFAILNALYRSRTLPPFDPWFAGEPLNYFYFGHLLVATFGRLTGVPPAMAFNLGVATLGALLATGAFAAGRQMGGKRAGLLAASGTVLLGNLAGVRLALAEPGRALDFDFFWATSRVIPGTINEYPFWSLIFGDLHAHLLALPFDIALVYVASLWVTGVGGAASRSRILVAVLAAWLAGASVASNAWNLPVAMVVPVAFLATAWRRGQRTLGSLVSTVCLGGVVWLFGWLLFLPFHLHYRKTDLVSWGWEQEAASLVDVVTVFGLFLLVVLPSLLIRARRVPSAGSVVLSTITLGAIAWLRSLTTALYLGTTLLAAAVWFRARSASVQTASLLAAIAAGIGLMTETVYVSDRMNTVFKYYMHVWILLALAAGVLLPRTLALVSRGKRRLWKDLLAVAAVCGLFTSAAATIGLLRFPPMRSPTATLNGTLYLREARPAEGEAFQWLEREVDGAPVLLEAQGPPYELYSRVSMNTGLPTVLGWEHHLRQQARTAEQIAARRRDVRTIFETTDHDTARSLLDRYRVDFVFVGPLERQTYSREGLSKFEVWKNTEVVFRNRDVTIHARPGVLESMKARIGALP